MNDNRLTIGEMAALNNISVQTLRHYSKLGLIEPSHTDPHTGYRYYDIKQSYVLDVIVYLKNLGLSLKEIGDWFAEPDLDQIRGELAEHDAALADEIRRLSLARAAISRLRARIDTVRNQGELMSPRVEVRPTRLVHSFAITANFHTEGSGRFELLMRAMKKWLLAGGLPLSYFSNVGSRIYRQNFVAGDLTSYSLFITADDYSKRRLAVEAIAPGSYLCIYFTGFEQEGHAIDLLREEIARRALTVVGDYICETVFEFPLFRQAERQSLICAQVQVEATRALDEPGAKQILSAC